LKKINLPITRRYATGVVDLVEARKALASGKVTEIFLGTIDFGASGRDLDQARANGGIVIWSAIGLEEKVGSVIMGFLFPSKDNPKGRHFFANRILGTDQFSFSTKKRLLVELVHEESLLEGLEKDRLTKALKEVMDFRNAFAHGDLIYREDAGCVLSYWSGGAKAAVLSDEFWEKLEASFKTAHELLDRILEIQHSSFKPGAASGDTK
jgi:hypothetical protein